MLISVGRGLCMLFLGYCLLLLPLSIEAATRSELLTVEKSMEFSEKTMYTMSQFTDLLQEIHAICPQDSLNSIAGFIQNLEQKYQRNYANMTDADVLYNSRTLYEQIREVHERLRRLNDDELCTAKYIMYRMQYRLRNMHITKLQDTTLIDDMDSYDPTELRGYEIKLAYLNRLIEVYQPYSRRLWTTLTFRIQNPEIRNGLSSEEKLLVDRTQQLMQLIIIKVMYDLKVAWVLDNEDITMLKDRYVLSYEPGCEKFFGKYQATLVYDDGWNLIDKRFDNLELKLSVCSNFFIIKEFPFYFQKIITHELGHHVYYFVDPDTKSFEKICRLSDTKQNGKCAQQDFASEYAAVLGTEDYAETFMHRFLDVFEHSTPVLQRKIDHFTSLFWQK